jgi:hypothetical protein
MIFYYLARNSVRHLKVDRNETFCVIRLYIFTAVLSSQIALKVQNLLNFVKSKLNMKTFSRQLKPDSCQTHQFKNDLLTPYSWQTRTPPYPTIGGTIASFALVATTSFTIRTSIFPASHEWQSSSVTDVGYAGFHLTRSPQRQQDGAAVENELVKTLKSRRVLIGTAGPESRETVCISSRHLFSVMA